MAVAVRSFATAVSSPPSVAGNVGVSVSAPSGLAVGDYYLILAFFGTITGNVSANTPTGFTAVTPTGGSTSTRLMAAFGRQITSSSDVSAVSSVTVTAATSATTRANVVGLALTGVDTTTPVQTTGTLVWNASASASITLPTIGSGDLSIFAACGNASSTSTHATYTPNAGTKVVQTTSLSSATDPASDSVLTVITGAASTVTMSSSVANSGAIGYGLKAAPAVTPSAVTLSPAVVSSSGVALTPITPSAVTLSPAVVTSAGTALTPTANTPGASAVTLSPASLASSGAPLSPAAGRVTIALSPASVRVVAQPFAQPATINAWLSTATYYAAHRGGGDNYPEHTMSAYDNAYARGMKAIEVSTHRTADGVWICHHDTTLTRMTGDTRTIASTNYADLSNVTTGAYYADDRDGVQHPTTDTTTRQPIAPLTDVLAKYLGKVVLLIEAKNGNDAGALLTLLDTYGTPTTSVVWKQWAGSNAGTTSAASKGYFRWAYFNANDDLSNISTWAARGEMLGANYLDTDADVTTIVNYGKAQNPVKRTMMWAIHDQTTRDHARDLGVDGFMTSNLNAVNTTPVAAQTVALSPALVSTAGQGLGAAAGPVSVALSPTTITLGAPSVSPVPGAVAVSLAPAAVALAGVPLSPGAGAVSVPLSPVVLSTLPQSLGTSGPSTVALVPGQAVLFPSPDLYPSSSVYPTTAASVTITAQPLGVTPGPVTLSLAVVTVNLSARSLTPSPQAVTLALAAALLAVQGVPLAVSPGARTVELFTVNVLLSLLPLTPHSFSVEFGAAVQSPRLRVVPNRAQLHVGVGTELNP